LIPLLTVIVAELTVPGSTGSLNVMEIVVCCATPVALLNGEVETTAGDGA